MSAATDLNLWVVTRADGQPASDGRTARVWHDHEDALVIALVHDERRPEHAPHRATPLVLPDQSFATRALFAHLTDAHERLAVAEDALARKGAGASCPHCRDGATLVASPVPTAPIVALLGALGFFCAMAVWTIVRHLFS